MSTANRTRAERVAAMGVAPRTAEWRARLRGPRAGWRLLIALLTSLAMWGVTRGWRPPLGFRAGDLPLRNIVARVEFSRPDLEQLEVQRRRRRSETVLVYANDPRPLHELAQALRNRVFQLLAADTWEELDQAAWQEFRGVSQDAEKEQQTFVAFREALKDDMELRLWERAVDQALRPSAEDGLLDVLHDREEGSQTALLVHPVGNVEFQHRVEVKDAQVAEALARLPDRTSQAFLEVYGESSQHMLLAEMASAWLVRQRLPTTLRIDQEESELARQAAVDAVKTPRFVYHPGDLVVRGGAPLSRADIDLLRLEHQALIESLGWSHRLRHTFADWGMYGALAVLCGFYMASHTPMLFRDLRRLSLLMGIAVVTVAAAEIAAQEQWRAELVPLALFGMTVAITQTRDLALLMVVCVSLIVTLSAGRQLGDFVILVAGAGAAVLPCTRIRSRPKLIYVGLLAGLVAALTTVGVGTLTFQTFSVEPLFPLPWENETLQFALGLARGALWHGFCLVVSGLLITGLLPFVERLFDVQTDISLLELGDAAHPLLRQLAQRAPGTYNHSINVGTLAEAAAEAIGANGLLARVGAYFHDIGKMLKPGYFIENQGQSPSRHESLLPAMSTLVIIAHVKDGADLARQHHLPRALIDFIEQHHGTTLVEYFYRQATQQSEVRGDDEEVEEVQFRYPGPKPQTREAAVLMLADACESASRALGDPAPSRIEHLVREIGMKRLLDGQFDECRLTLRELATIESTLAKSLIAFYHGRIKYVDTQTA